MIDANETMKVIAKNGVYKVMAMTELVKDIESEDMLLAAVGTVVDSWASNKGMSIGKADDLYKSFYKVAKRKHKEVGL